MKIKSFIPVFILFAFIFVKSQNLSPEEKKLEKARQFLNDYKLDSAEINLKDLIGVLNISGKDFKDSSNQMQQQTEDALMRVLAMATTAGV